MTNTVGRTPKLSKSETLSNPLTLSAYEGVKLLPTRFVDTAGKALCRKRVRDLVHG